MHRWAILNVVNQLSEQAIAGILPKGYQIIAVKRENTVQRLLIEGPSLPLTDTTGETLPILDCVLTAGYDEQGCFLRGSLKIWHGSADPLLPDWASFALDWEIGHWPGYDAYLAWLGSFKSGFKDSQEGSRS